MFTGIIEEVGTVASISGGGQSLKIKIACKTLLTDVKIGDSIAVEGICLTVTQLNAAANGTGFFTADVMPETFRRTALRLLHNGSRVNLEKAMRADGRFGGHIVTGHIDGTGVIHSIVQDENAVVYTIRAPQKITLGIVEKGSVALDGISLTVASVGKTHAYGEDCFSVSLIPHTQKNTSLVQKKKGNVINIECDILGKYAARFAAAQNKSVLESLNYGK